MLQPAASSAQSTPSPMLGGPSATAENAGVPKGFAALLASGMDSDGETAATAPIFPAVGMDQGAVAIRQAGKLTGNILPVLLPDGKILPAQFESDATEAAETTIEAVPVGQSPADPTLTALIFAQTAPIVTVPTPRAIVAEPGPLKAATPQPAVAPDQATTIAQMVATPMPVAEGETQPTSALTTSPETTNPSPTKAATNQSKAGATEIVDPTLAVQADQPARPATVDVPAIKATTDFRATLAPAVLPVVAPERIATDAEAAATKASPATPANVLKATMPVSAALPGVEAGKPVKAEPSANAVRTETTATAQPAAILAGRIELPIGQQPQAVAEVVSSRADAGASPPAAAARALPASEAAAARVTSATPELTAFEPAKPIAAAELQPILAFRDAQPATASTNAPVTTSAAALQPQGHDFATLVDRLVEARDAAMPQAVKAAIHHADFGQVSLNFRTDDNRLTVSMASADPGFAPAVQAAAAMQANTSTDSGTNSQRQDGASQQHANASTSGNGQPQPQAQSQTSTRNGERERGDLHRQTNGQGIDSEVAQTQDEARPGRRGSIYA